MKAFSFMQQKTAGGLRVGRRFLRTARFLHIRKSKFPSTDGYAVITLRRLPSLREPFVLQMLRLLRALGYVPVFYISSIKELVHFARLSESVFSDYQPLISLTVPPRTYGCVLVTDHESKLGKIAWHKILNIEFDLSRSKHELLNPFFVPYPDRSIGWLEAEMKSNRNRKKKIRVLFAGAYRGYAGRGIQRYLGKMERESIVEVFKTFPKTRVVKSGHELERLLSTEDEEPVCCFVDTEHFRIPQAEWFSILSQTDIFLCPPGIVHPFCHNSIEAMAVGTIPLLNYGEWFHPRLTPNVNCLTFRDEAELVARLEWAINAGPAALKEIQDAALAYYDQHLDHKTFVHRLKQQTVNNRQINLVVTTEIADFLPRLTPQSLAFG